MLCGSWHRDDISNISMEQCDWGHRNCKSFLPDCKLSPSRYCCISMLHKAQQTSVIFSSYANITASTYFLYIVIPLTTSWLGRQHYKINTPSLSNKHDIQQTTFYKYADRFARSVFLFPKYTEEPRAGRRGQAKPSFMVTNIVVYSLLLPSKEDQIFNKGHVVTSRRTIVLL